MTTFLGFCAFAVDFGHWYLVGEQTQKAADAAALAAVVNLPDDFDNAQTTAARYAALNGFPVASGTSVTTSRVMGDPGRLSVTVSTTVGNFFTGLFGVPTSTISSTGDASYVGSVKMGSPCNRLGSDPDATADTEAAACQGLATGRYWLNVSGPDTDKSSGDPYQTLVCTQSVSDHCPGGTNTDYTPDGYGYNVTVKVGGPVQIEIFDPAWVNVGDLCDKNLATAKNAVNPYVTDASTRYAAGNLAGNKWCTGDSTAKTGVISDTFSLLGTTGGDDIASHDPVPLCTRTWTGYDGDLFKALNAASPGYRPEVAESFRRWVPLCTVTGAGTYVLKVTAPLGSSMNRFAVRAVGRGMATTTVSGREKLDLYTSDDNPATQFFLARVPSTGAGQTLVVRFFDIGDAKSAGKITIKPPSGSVGCKQYDVTDRLLGNLDPCVITTSSAYNGKWRTLRIPVPTTYRCQDFDNTACWYTVSFDYQGSAPTDTSAWTAKMDGQAVRLVR